MNKPLAYIIFGKIFGKGKFDFSIKTYQEMTQDHTFSVFQHIELSKEKLLETKQQIEDILKLEDMS